MARRQLGDGSFFLLVVCGVFFVFFFLFGGPERGQSHLAVARSKRGRSDGETALSLRVSSTVDVVARVVAVVAVVVPCACSSSTLQSPKK